MVWLITRRPDVAFGKGKLFKYRISLQYALRGNYCFNTKAIDVYLKAIKIVDTIRKYRHYTVAVYNLVCIAHVVDTAAQDNQSRIW